MRWLDAKKIPSMVIGGVAASVLGRPRMTQDIDVLAIVPEADWTDAMGAAAGFGIVPRIEHALDFARRSRVLLLKHTPSGIDLDVALGGLSFEEAAVANCVTHQVGGVSVRLPRVQDLVIMKAIARRPKDLQDIEGLLAAHPEIEVALIRQRVSEFASAMSMSDMLDEFDRLVARRSPKTY
jgi:hypothetical protein